MAAASEGGSSIEPTEKDLKKELFDLNREISILKSRDPSSERLSGLEGRAKFLRDKLFPPESDGEEKVEPRVKQCDLYQGDKTDLKFDNLVLVILPNPVFRIECLTRQEIRYMLNKGGEQLYEWDIASSSSIKNLPVYRLSNSLIFLDKTAKYLTFAKICMLQYRGIFPIGSSFGVSALHGEKHKLYSVELLNPETTFELLQPIREKFSASLEIRDEEYKVLSNKLVAINKEREKILEEKGSLIKKIETEKKVEVEDPVEKALELMDKFFAIGKGLLLEKGGKEVAVILIKPDGSRVRLYVPLTTKSILVGIENEDAEFDLDEYATMNLNKLRTSLWEDLTTVESINMEFIIKLPDKFTIPIRTAFVEDFYKINEFEFFNEHYAYDNDGDGQFIMKKIKVKPDPDKYPKIFKNKKYREIMLKLGVMDYAIKEIKLLMGPFARKLDEQRYSTALEINKMFSKQVIDVGDAKIAIGKYILNIVRDVLAKDKTMRYEGITKDIFTLDEISPGSHWDLVAEATNLPMIAGSTEEKQIMTNLEHFRKNLYRNNNHHIEIIFETILANNPVLLAGGSVSGGLIGKNLSYRDYDLFIYTPDISGTNFLSDKDKRELGNKVFNNIIKYLNEKKLLDKFVKGKNYVNFTIVLGNRFDIDSIFVNIQLILRVYNTLSEIIHGFDLGSSAVGYDGENVYFTTLSKFAYEFGENIADPSRRSTTYGKRIEKYTRYGFPIILPHLDIEQIKRDLKEQKDDVKKEKVIEISLPENFEIQSCREQTLVCSGYYTHKQISLTTDTDYESFHSDYRNNIASIAHDDYKNIYISLGRNNINEFLDQSNHPNLIERITNICIGLIRTDYRRISKLIFNPELLYHKLSIMYYLPTYGKLMELINSNSQLEYELLLKKSVYELITKVRDLKNHTDEIVTFNWMTHNAMTQLTSSFNPIIEDDEKWYGKYYKKNPYY